MTMLKKTAMILILCVLILSACQSAPTEETLPLAITEAAPTRAPTLAPSPAPPTATTTACPPDDPRYPCETPASSPAGPTARVSASPSPMPPAATLAASPTAPASTPETGGPAINPIAHLAAGQPVTVTAIHMLDAATGWAVAAGGAGDPDDHLLRTTDGGATWRDVTPPENNDPAAPLGKGATTFFLDANTAWAAYYDRTAAPVTAPPVIWRTADAGETWTPSRPLAAQDASFYSPSDLVFVDSRNGWLLAHVDAGMMHDYVYGFATTDGGQAWEKIVDPFMDNLPMSCGKTGMAFVDARTGWVTGDCQGVQPGAPYLQKTVDGGPTWKPVELPPPTDQPDLFTRDDVGCGTYSLTTFSPQSAVLVVKCLFFGVDPLRTDNFLYATTDGGKTWRSGSSPASAVTFVNPDTGWALTAATSNDPTAPRDLYQTQDGGQTWTKIKTVNWDGQLSFITNQEGWAVAKAGDAAALVHTTDGGKTWKEVKPQIAP
jgi:photosystem II stability/assembly factor-like uncharacterized protein